MNEVGPRNQKENTNHDKIRPMNDSKKVEKSHTQEKNKTGIKF